MDWQGFTKRADVAELEKLHNLDYRAQFIQRTLQEFLQGLEENAFNGTQILAELVRLGFLEIKLIKNFRGQIEQMQSRLSSVTPDADGLKQFILLHYGFESDQPEQLDFGALNDRETWDEDYEEETVAEQQEKRQQLRRTIDLAIARLQADLVEARRVYNLMWSACDNDLMQLQEIQDLLADEFVKDHKREQVTRKVGELVSQGKKVLLISIFSDTVIEYYRYMTQDELISSRGIGMAIGGTKRYYPGSSDLPVQVAPHNTLRSGRQRTGITPLLEHPLSKLYFGLNLNTTKVVAKLPSGDGLIYQSC